MAITFVALLILTTSDVDSRPSSKSATAAADDYNNAYAFDYRVYGTGDQHQPAQYFGQSEHRSDDRIVGQVSI